MVKRHIPLAILLACVVLIARASAEEFPNRPITWVVPFAPGGITDTTSRIVAEEMSKTLGQTVLIDNRGGGGGTVGTEQVARAKPDGYTMIYGTQGTMAANVTLRKSLPYDPLTSFLQVHLVGESPNLFVAYHGCAVQFGAGVHRLRQAESGQGDVSSSGVGTATHLVAELFKTVAGIDMLHVPYKGSAPALNDLIAGRVDVMFDYPVSVGSHVEAGKLKVLATTAPERIRNAPNAPTMAELGMKDMTTQSWSSIMVPAGTPAPVVDRLAAAAHAALTSERVRTHSKNRHSPDDAAKGGDDPVHREGDQALGRRDRAGGVGEAVASVTSARPHRLLRSSCRLVPGSTSCPSEPTWHAGTSPVMAEVIASSPHPRAITSFIPFIESDSPFRFVFKNPKTSEILPVEQAALISTVPSGSLLTVTFPHGTHT